MVKITFSTLADTHLETGIINMHNKMHN